MTIPKKIRDKYGLAPRDEVTFLESRGEIILRKRESTRPESRLHRWVGFLQDVPASVDDFIEDLRGR